MFISQTCQNKYLTRNCECIASGLETQLPRIKIVQNLSDFDSKPDNNSKGRSYRISCSSVALQLLILSINRAQRHNSSICLSKLHSALSKVHPISFSYSKGLGFLIRLHNHRFQLILWIKLNHLVASQSPGKTHGEEN